MVTPQEKTQFIATCSSVIRYNLDGNPLGLESFINKIMLIEEIVEQKLVATFIAFVKSKSQGIAREALPDNINPIDDIIKALRARIKPDNSKDIVGRIAALHVRNGNFQEFSKQAEDLADALERSIVIESITKVKAQEIAVKHTVSVC